MIELLVHHVDPPQLEQLHLIRSRGRSSRRSRTGGGALVIGAVILLDGGKTPCRVVALDPVPLCVPVDP